MIGLQSARPPFIEFYVSAVPDVAKTQELGRRVTKDVNMVRIVQPGSKDDNLHQADEWLARIKQKRLDDTHDAYPEEWIIAIQNKYEFWKKGQEAPVNGTSIKEWPILSPSQVQNLLACHIQTVEDVAEMTEQAMLSYGMGARELKAKAKEWLAGKEMAKAAISENEALRAEVGELRAKLAEMEEKANNSEKPRRGRKPKEG